MKGFEQFRAAGVEDGPSQSAGRGGGGRGSSAGVPAGNEADQDHDRRGCRLVGGGGHGGGAFRRAGRASPPGDQFGDGTPGAVEDRRANAGRGRPSPQSGAGVEMPRPAASCRICLACRPTHVTVSTGRGPPEVVKTAGRRSVPCSDAPVDLARPVDFADGQRVEAQDLLPGGRQAGHEDHGVCSGCCASIAVGKAESADLNSGSYLASLLLILIGSRHRAAARHDSLPVGL